MSSGAADLRVGIGFDVHPFCDDENRMLVLGGIAFPGARPLRGHSDADVIAHACADALLGAADMGDIGALFADTDERWAGADSIELLADVAQRLATAGWVAINVDTTVVCDEPKIAPKRAEMSKRLSDAVGAPVTVKGKRTEGVSGLGGGIRCHSVALICRTGGGTSRKKDDEVT